MYAPQSIIIRARVSACSTLAVVYMDLRLCENGDRQRQDMFASCRDIDKPHKADARVTSRGSSDAPKLVERDINLFTSRLRALILSKEPLTHHISLKGRNRHIHAQNTPQ